MKGGLILVFTFSLIVWTIGYLIIDSFHQQLSPIVGNQIFSYMDYCIAKTGNATFCQEQFNSYLDFWKFVTNIKQFWFWGGLGYLVMLLIMIGYSHYATSKSYGY